MKKIIKISAIISKGFTKRAHNLYKINKINQMANKILESETNQNIKTDKNEKYAAAAAAAATTASTAAPTAEEKQKAIDDAAEEEKKKIEKAAEDEKKKIEEEETKRLEEEKKLIDAYKLEVDDLVKNVGVELDKAISG
mmetsp:Transcript_47855/g.40476  ORF Transcript_47855/g.40476 Transcript_47855/m.40476 type:complete len:139 (+) Transcript_47855:521-937(+)